MKRFTLEKKTIGVVRYYETMYIVRGPDGERLFTGGDEKVARHVARLLNGYHGRRSCPRKTKPAKKRRK